MQCHLRFPPRVCLGASTFSYLHSNDLTDNISSQIRLFADDCIIILDSLLLNHLNFFQSDLDPLSSWAGKWQMRFNRSIHNTRHGNQFPVTLTHFLNDQALERTDAHPYLGIIISSDFRLNNHCDYQYVVKKSSKTLDFISRNFYHCTRETKAKLYLGLVRPSLEYARSA